MGMFSNFISEEEFSFMLNRQYHDVAGLAQEGLHWVKLNNLPTRVLKIDLFKAYDKVNCMLIRLVLLQLVMDINTINWIMGCISSTSFEMFINDSHHPSLKLQED